MPIQTTQRTQERLGRAGMPRDNYAMRAVTRIAEVAGFRPGDLALRGTAISGGAGTGTVKKVVTPPAASATAIIASGLGSTTGIQTITSFNGAIGGGHMLPSRLITLVLSSHADWDATTAVLTTLDPYGRVQQENLAIPNNGGVTLTATKLASKIISLVIPAQSGTGGTATMGITSALGPLTSLDVVGIVSYLAARQVLPQALGGASAEFSQYDTLEILQGGAVWLEPEAAVADGDQVLVRLVASGPQVLGAFTNVDDGTPGAENCVPVIGLRFRSASETRDGVITAPASLDFPNI